MVQGYVFSAGSTDPSVSDKGIGVYDNLCSLDSNDKISPTMEKVNIDGRGFEH